MKLRTTRPDVLFMFRRCCEAHGNGRSCDHGGARPSGERGFALTTHLVGGRGLGLCWGVPSEHVTLVRTWTRGQARQVKGAVRNPRELRSRPRSGSAASRAVTSWLITRAWKRAEKGPLGCPRRIQESVLCFVDVTVLVLTLRPTIAICGCCGHGSAIHQSSSFHSCFLQAIIVSSSHVAATRNRDSSLKESVSEWSKHSRCALLSAVHGRHVGLDRGRRVA